MTVERAAPDAASVDAVIVAGIEPLSAERNDGPPVASRPSQSAGEFTRRYAVLELVRIERIEEALAGLRLRVHQERDRGLLRAGQLDVVRIVEGNPVTLPGAEQRLARRRDLGVRQGEVARRFLQHDLAYVGGIDRRP